MVAYVLPNAWYPLKNPFWLALKGKPFGPPNCLVWHIPNQFSSSPRPIAVPNFAHDGVSSSSWLRLADFAQHADAVHLFDEPLSKKNNTSGPARAGGVGFWSSATLLGWLSRDVKKENHQFGSAPYFDTSPKSKCSTSGNTQLLSRWQITS